MIHIFISTRNAEAHENIRYSIQNEQILIDVVHPQRTVNISQTRLWLRNRLAAEFIAIKAIQI